MERLLLWPSDRIWTDSFAFVILWNAPLLPAGASLEGYASPRGLYSPRIIGRYRLASALKDGIEAARMPTFVSMTLQYIAFVIVQVGSVLFNIAGMNVMRMIDDKQALHEVNISKERRNTVRLTKDLERALSLTRSSASAGVAVSRRAEWVINT